MSTKVAIKIKDVLALLNEGKVREEIASHYGISRADVNALFQHPELKNKKPRKPLGFVIVDEEEDVAVTDVAVTETDQELQNNMDETAPEEVLQSPGLDEEDLVEEQEAAVEAVESKNPWN